MNDSVSVYLKLLNQNLTLCYLRIRKIDRAFHRQMRYIQFFGVQVVGVMNFDIVIVRIVVTIISIDRVIFLLNINERKFSVLISKSWKEKAD